MRSLERLKSMIWILAQVALLVLSAACAPNPGAIEPDRSTATFATSAPTMAQAAARVLPTVTVEPTLAPPLTPQDIESAKVAVTRALQASNASAFAPLMLDEIYLAQGPNGEQGKSITRAAALQWLNARWGAARRVTSSDYVEHTVLLEITTTGWANVDPLQSGLVVFHLHRYNAQGQPDPNQGAWRIDTILYR